MKDLRVTVVQTELYWEDIKANIDNLTTKIEPIKDTDLIILPEMFSTGFSMNPGKLAEDMNGEAVSWLKEIAKKKNINICGSIIIKENTNYVNRFCIANPAGELKYYDKRHLFRMGNEHNHYNGGSERIIFTIGKWRICPLICYDLRFPVWSRNKNEYDLLIYVANWPGSRSLVWGKLLMARAIENQSYVIGVNRVGKDGTGISYSGDSVIIDPKGNPVQKAKANEEVVFTENLSLEELYDFRNKFPVSLDADDFKIL